jgi:hypothetical protein
MMQLILCASLLFGMNQESFLIVEDEYQGGAILEEYGDYQLLINREKWFLTYLGTTIGEWNHDQQLNVEFMDPVLYVSFLDYNAIYLLQLEEGVVVKETKVEDGTYTEHHLLIDDGVYIFGGVQGAATLFTRKSYHQKIDAFLIKLDFDFQIIATTIIGGWLDEWFTGMLNDGEQLFLWGYKDTLTGGDFCNAGHEKGCNFLIAFDWEQPIVSEFYVADESITSLTKEEETLILLTEMGLYRLDSSLHVLHTFKFDLQSRFVRVMPNQLVLVITASEVKIFTTIQFNLVYQAPLTHSFSSVFHGHNKILTFDANLFHELKIYDLRWFKKSGTYQETSLQRIFGIDSILELHHLTYLTPYQATVWGQYDVIYDFGEMNIPGVVEVTLETNVLENRIYPVGYQLEFTGLGYLDNEAIVNHHMVSTIGDHTLKLVSINGEEETIHFRIDREQLPIIDCYHESIDVVGEVNQPFVLPFIIHLPAGVDLKQIILNQEAVAFELHEDEVQIKRSEPIAGYYHYCIQIIEFSQGDRKWTQPLAMEINALVRQSSPNVQMSFTETHEKVESLLSIQDDERQLRGMFFSVEGEMGIIETLVTIKDQTIILNNLQVGTTYQVHVALAYDDGGNDLMKVALFDFSFEANDSSQSLGQVRVLQRGASIEEMAIDLVKNKSLHQINMDGELLYLHQEHSYGWYVLFGLMGGIAGYTIIQFVRIRRHKTNR